MKMLTLIVMMVLISVVALAEKKEIGKQSKEARESIFLGTEDIARSIYSKGKAKKGLSDRFQKRSLRAIDREPGTYSRTPDAEADTYLGVDTNVRQSLRGYASAPFYQIYNLFIKDSEKLVFSGIKNLRYESCESFTCRLSVTLQFNKGDVVIKTPLYSHGSLKSARYMAEEAIFVIYNELNAAAGALTTGMPINLPSDLQSINDVKNPVE